MKFINVLLAIVVSLVIGALVLEGGLRLIGKGPTKTMLAFDSELGWHKEAGTSFKRKMPEFKVTYEINELGLRDDPMSDPTKPANVFRVLVLGDSFAQGWSVPRENLFVDQLERWWKAENRRVDVINAGTEAYSTDQSVAWLVKHGSTFKPDLVLLFPYENDIYWNGQSDYMGRQKPHFDKNGLPVGGVLEDTKQESWTELFALTKKLAPKPDVAHHLFEPVNSSKPMLLKEHAPVLIQEPLFMQEAKDGTRGAFLAFRRACDELEATGVVVPIPSKSVVNAEARAKHGEKVLGMSEDRWDPNKPVDTLLSLAKAAGIETLDPRTTLKATARGQKLYNDIDWHFNRDGNVAFASFLHDELDHIGAFPAAHSAPAGAPVDLPMPDRSAEGAPFWLKLYAVLWVALTLLYLLHYPDEPKWQPPLKVAALLSSVFAIIYGANTLVGLLPPQYGPITMLLLVVGILSFIVYKIGRRMATIAELMKSFVLRGHWYLMPLIVVLLTIGSLLVVAASSPLVAPFIYTLF
jgi:hypothetical protein